MFTLVILLLGAMELMHNCVVATANTINLLLMIHLFVEKGGMSFLDFFILLIVSKYFCGESSKAVDNTFEI